MCRFIGDKVIKYLIDKIYNLVIISYIFNFRKDGVWAL